MGDIKTLYRAFGGDWQVLTPGLVEDGGLDTAVVISLFTDRRAEADDLPAGEERRGWWGDSYADTEGDRIGSRLWLLQREKQLPAVVTRAEEYIKEALAWLTEDGIAGPIEVTAAIISTGVLAAEIRIYRNDDPPVRYRFEQFWQGQTLTGV